MNCYSYWLLIDVTTIIICCLYFTLLIINSLYTLFHLDTVIVVVDCSYNQVDNCLYQLYQL